MSNRYSENFNKELIREPDPHALWRALNIIGEHPALAFDLFKNLSDKGSNLSMMYIGDAYEKGWGVSSDKLLAIQWYQNAANHGSIEARHRVACLYWQSHIFDKAVDELIKLSKMGCMPAMYLLGFFYFFGRGVPANPAEAKKYFKMAEKRGHLLAKQTLGHLLLRGNFGVFGILKGAIKIAAMVIPYVYWNMKYPASDRLRGW